MNLMSWTREPLVHFLALGFVLYMALTWGGNPPDPASRVISVGSAEREKIAESWTLSMGRAPTDAELDQAVESFVREEVLYREALRLGLDEEDAIVRRRLVSKMDFSASLVAETAEPTDAMLEAYLDANTERYAQMANANAALTFEQAFFIDEARARSALGQNSPASDPTSLAKTVVSEPVREVEARFGQQFAQGISQLEPSEEWQGPVPSGFGWHLIRLNERAVEPPDFKSLRTVLANDWRAEQIATRKQRAYDVLASAYRIEVSE